MTTHTRDDSDLLERLQAPMDRSKHKAKRVKGAEFTYVSAHHYIARMISCYGNDWDLEIVDVHETARAWIAKVKITVHRVSPRDIVREAVGGQPKLESTSDEDLIKAAITDAVKKGLSWLGIGLELYVDEQLEYMHSHQDDSSSTSAAAVAQPVAPPVAPPVALAEPWRVAKMLQLFADAGVSEASVLRSLCAPSADMITVEQLDRARRRLKELAARGREPGQEG